MFVQDVFLYLIVTRYKLTVWRRRKEALGVFSYNVKRFVLKLLTIPYEMV
jgi:hypothetical protein